MTPGDILHEKINPLCLKTSRSGLDYTRSPAHMDTQRSQLVLVSAYGFPTSGTHHLSINTIQSPLSPGLNHKFTTMKKLIFNPIVLGLTVIVVIFLALHLTHFNDLNFTR
jgi:hypothetical protein